MSEKKVKITQSLMKEFYDYYHGNQCGLIFEEKYIHKNYEKFPSSDVQKLGLWFEYQCIGATTKQSKIPEAERNKKGGELTAAYKRMETQVKNFKMFMNYYGIEILEVQPKWDVGEMIIEIDGKNGEKISHPIDGLEGTLDILCRAKIDIKATYEVKNDKGKVTESQQEVVIKAGQKFICDIKSTGLLDDKWSDFSWNLDNLHTKDKIIRQPIHYKFLSYLKHGESLPFLFLLFSTTNDYDYRSILFNIDEDTHFKEHKEFIVWTDKWLKYTMKKGFVARPEFLRCMDCPLKVTCKHFQGVPKIANYFYQPQTT